MGIAVVSADSALHVQALIAEVMPLPEPGSEDGSCMKGLASATGLETAGAIFI